MHKTCIFRVWHSLHTVAVITAGILALPLLGISQASLAETVTLEVLNPRGEIPPPPLHAPSARIPDLNGKKVGIYWIGKAGGDNFWDGVEALLNERYPQVKTQRYEGPFDLGDEEAARLAGEVDTMFYGVGD